MGLLCSVLGGSRTVRISVGIYRHCGAMLDDRVLEMWQAFHAASGLVGVVDVLAEASVFFFDHCTRNTAFYDDEVETNAGAASRSASASSDEFPPAVSFDANRALVLEPGVDFAQFKEKIFGKIGSTGFVGYAVVGAHVRDRLTLEKKAAGGGPGKDSSDSFVLISTDPAVHEPAPSTQDRLDYQDDKEEQVVNASDGDVCADFLRSLLQAVPPPPAEKLSPAHVIQNKPLVLDHVRRGEFAAALTALTCGQVPLGAPRRERFLATVADIGWFRGELLQWVRRFFRNCIVERLEDF